MNVIYQNDDSIDSDSALIKTHSKFEDLEKLLEYVRAYNNKLNVKKMIIFIKLLSISL